MRTEPEVSERSRPASALDTHFEQAGSLEPPGPLGRLARLGLGALCLGGARELWLGRAYLSSGGIPWSAEWVVGVAIVVAVLPYVINIGLGVSLRHWPRTAVVLAMATGAAWNLAELGEVWSPALGTFLLGWQFLTLTWLGASFLVAAALSTPGCEMRAFPHLWTLLTGRHTSEHYCPGPLDRIDRWEAER